MYDGLGEISITINGKTSNIIPFTIREGRIFFIESDNPGGDGSVYDPFYFSDTVRGSRWLANMQVGDVFYFKDSSVYTERVNGGNSHLWLRDTNTSGTMENPIAFLAFLAYPNQKLVFKVASPYTVNFKKATDLGNLYCGRNKSA